jgi:2'-5' RNA ligase
MVLIIEQFLGMCYSFGMQHRLFVGLQLPESFHSNLATWRMQHADWPVRWTRATDLHLTMVPPWEVDSVQPVINAFYTLNGFFKQQSITFNQIHFIHPEAPKMLWVEGEPTADLTDMKQRLHSVFERPTEEQAFRPHITLARCWPDQVAAIQQTTEAIHWVVPFEALVLYESMRDHFGSRYKVLASIAA